VTNFKSGSGNLDFGGDDDASDAAGESDTDSDGSESAPGGDAEEASQGEAPAPTDTADQSRTVSATGAGAVDADTSSAGDTSETYPYFVRRNNVGDERDTRLEIHVRDKVAEGEAQFRHALAAELGASDVSKTDAREFALLAAFRHPERVAELMREEGFDSLG